MRASLFLTLAGVFTLQLASGPVAAQNPVNYCQTAAPSQAPRQEDLCHPIGVALRHFLNKPLNSHFAMFPRPRLNPKHQRVWSNQGHRV
jgi:hypothetical protein